MIEWSIKTLDVSYFIRINYRYNCLLAEITDIFMVFIFLPSFFILFSILSFLINRFFIRKISIKILLSVILYGLSFFASYFLFKDIWSFNVRFISISLTSLVGLIHYLISYGLSLVNSAIRKKLDENIG